MSQQLTSEDIQRAKRINLAEWFRAQGFPSSIQHPTQGLFSSPFRRDRQPSLSISMKDGIALWHDFGTREGGDAIDFVQRFLQVSFRDAVLHLLNHSLLPTAAPQPPQISTTQDPQRIRDWHQRALTHMTTDTQASIQQYFLSRSLPWLPDTQPVRLFLRAILGDPQSERIPFIAWPMPNPRHIQALECRAMVPTNGQYQRRAFPTKTIWTYTRPGQPMLITESIQDCLAGETLFRTPFSHLALNGLPQVSHLKDALHTLKPPAIYLALDHEPKAKHTHRTRQEALDILRPLGLPLCLVNLHAMYDTKDFLRLLAKAPQGFSLEHLSRTGRWYLPPSIDPVMSSRP